MEQGQFSWEFFVGVRLHLIPEELLSLGTVNACFAGVIGQQFYTYWTSGGSNFLSKM
jgi:hypothetical protein